LQIINPSFEVYLFPHFFRLAAVFMGGEYGNPLSKPENDFGKSLIGPIAQKDRAAVSYVHVYQLFI
jgi:hypothetical protein